MDSRVFDQKYKSLNPAQKKAVDAIDGPVMVIAGPGTGKTTILTLRIANILRKTDTPPDAILALTFTESGVRAMRKKLVEIIGPTAYRVKIHTFHSFANDIIKTYPDKFPRIIGAEHVEGIEQIALVEKILDGGDFKILRPKGDPAYYVSKIIATIKDLKREDILAEELSNLIIQEEKTILFADDLKHEKGKYKGDIKGKYQDALEAVEKNKELAQAYSAYEKELEKSRLYDFEDMIIEVAKRLSADQGFLLRIEEEHHYILADEHQDAYTAQNKLLELVSSFHENPNLFIVGDEKQAIFRFQGATLDNFLYFKNKFPQAQLIKLSENYRSHQTILDAAYELIGNNSTGDESLKVELKACASTKSRQIDYVISPDIESELSFVADEAEKLIKSGTKPSEIAVLIRNNRHAESVERHLSMRGVPVARFADSDALDHPYVQAFLSIIRAALYPADNELVAKSLFAPFSNIDLLEVSQAIESWRKEKGPLVKILDSFNEKMKKFGGELKRFGRMATNDPAVEAFEKIATESGFIEFIVGHEKYKQLVPIYGAVLSTVVRFAERNRSATLKDFIGQLDHAREHNYSISSSYMPPDGVQLMTAHGAKGLEFEYVFIVHATDNIWGGNRSHRAFKLPVKSLSVDEGDGETEDERRLFYVALTRAKKHAYITYAEHDAEGKELVPSRFIAEIPEKHIKHLKSTANNLLLVKQTKISQMQTDRAQMDKISDKQSQTGHTSGKHSILKDQDYLKSLFIERGFSVTHLNNFLECPWQYFFVNLLRLPKAQENPQLYGSAIHGALRDYFEAYKREEDIAVDQAVDLFEKYLSRTHMTGRDLDEYIESGRQELATYLKNYKFSRNIWNEYKITGVPFSVDGTEIMLDGILDKVELVESGAVNVIDYKTGKSQSRNKIEGKTKDGDGNYLRQLIFYKLIIDRYKSGEWKMQTGTIDFIKPDDYGKLHREIFIISDEQVLELEKLISDTARKILDLDLEGCEKEDCEWCKLAKVLPCTIIASK
jgi:DNA helicase-2/ATP-dependent DNA helicase PcrA